MPINKSLLPNYWLSETMPRLRFMLNAWLHVRVINFRIIIIIINAKNRLNSKPLLRSSSYLLLRMLGIRHKSWS